MVDVAMMPKLTAADLESARAKGHWGRTVQVCKQIETHMVFHIVVNSCIGVAGCVVGFSTDSSGDKDILWAVDFGCLVVFSFEVNSELPYFNTHATTLIQHYCLSSPLLTLQPARRQDDCNEA